jgi:hypothetical protein
MYYGYMNVTLSIEDELVKTVRKIAIDRDTTLAGLIREYLERVAAEGAAFGRRRSERARLMKCVRCVRLHQTPRSFGGP